MQVRAHSICASRSELLKYVIELIVSVTAASELVFTEDGVLEEVWEVAFSICGQLYYMNLCRDFTPLA